MRVLAMMGILVLGGCGDDCEVKAVQRIRSPDGEHDAVVYSVFCGFLVGANTAVSVTDPGAEPENAPAPFYVVWGNTLGDRTPLGGPAVEVRWIAKDSLHVTYRRTAFVKRMEARRENVAFTYEAVNDRQTRQ